ncbi:unnamed protein product [Caenorhabditis bovis]|uniref:SXP/RAL-2 family protein Ani s 5-like cation-binding domain-containing protein n=1 Tax=Caenorhabditis bovis TaxID=2654633 RepID=A0A8S1F0P5_9PELO|nr:unnamed protein product [Caenorhabditis bovis]
MLKLAFIAVTYLTYFVTNSEFHDDNTVEKILENAEVKTIEQINREIDKVVEKLDTKTRKEHKEWKLKVEKEEKQRKMRIFNVLPKLSTKTQQKLIRIVMTQQNQQLTVGEKERILKHIATSMDENVKRELARHLNQKDLFSILY